MGFQAPNPRARHARRKYADGVWAATTPNLELVRPHGNNEDTWRIKAAPASERFNYEHSDEELQEIARRTAAVAATSLDVQVVVNVNHENQGIRAGRRLAHLTANRES